MEHSKYPGFFEIPGYPGYYVAADSRVIDGVWDCSLIEKKTGQYNWYYFERIGATVHTHVIKARTFLPCVVGKTHVNHLDGDKKNNDILNLEWVSPSENLVHAFVSNLRTDNKPVTILDKETGKYEEFYSLNEASRRLGVNPEKLHRYMKSLRNALFQRRYVVLWGYENIHEIARRIDRDHIAGSPRSVVVERLTENRIEIYGSVASVARAFKVKDTRIRYYLKYPEKEFNGCKFKFAVGDEVGPVIIDWVVPKPPRRTPLKVKVRSPNGEENVWNSLEEFAKESGATKVAVQKAVYLKGSWRNYEIEYLR